ncbi:MAG TPA: thiolase family protein [Gemmataceae bacterium]|nr:thiolase family protein [Gemmataceae bacterium]
MLDIAILEGARTPFVKAFGPLAGVSAQELGRVATVEALKRAGMRPDQVDQVVIGNVAPPADAPNVARVIALTAGIPQDRIAHSVQRNCASGMEAITTAAQLIQLDEARTVVAGGTESMSQIPLLYNKDAVGVYLRLGRARKWWQRLGALLRFRPRHFKPVPAVQLGLTDPVCGLIMGETAEVLADDFHITRQEQDAYALESHRRAVDAQKGGVLAEEIVPFKGEAGRELNADIGPRSEQTMEALGKLRPFFRKDGTVTVGNSCMLTDGAAAVVLMPGAAARAEGRRPLGYLRGFAYAGCDPKRMGLGPIFATNKLLLKTGLGLKDIDLVELNEAFAAVVLANERAFTSDVFAREQLGRDKALGELDRARLNLNGGAIALGHPVGATGTRLVITLLKELRRRNLRRGLATLCVGGGQGGAVLVETE